MSSNTSNGTGIYLGYAFATRFYTPLRLFADGSRRKQPIITDLYGIGLMSGYNGPRINLGLSQLQKGGQSWLNSW
jgi:hypothetical protein